MTIARMLLLLRAESKRRETIALMHTEQAIIDSHIEVTEAMRKAADMIADMMIGGDGQ